MKPVGKAQGKGIFLFKNIADIKTWKRIDSESTENKKCKYVVSKYISNPLLIGNKKFDLRLYVLVTSFCPLTVWIHRQGFARFSTSEYNNEVENLHNNIIHLTNNAIQKKSSSKPNKWDIHSLRCFISSYYGRTEADLLFAKIQNVLLQTLRSTQSVVIHDSRCFELYGFDVLIDEALKPWLIEVNSSPSFSATNLEDGRLKANIIGDVLDILDLEQQHNGTEIKIGGFDLVFNNSSLVHTSDSRRLVDFDVEQECEIYYSSSMIGCCFDAEETLDLEVDS